MMSGSIWGLTSLFLFIITTHLTFEIPRINKIPCYGIVRGMKKASEKIAKRKCQTPYLQV